MTRVALPDNDDLPAIAAQLLTRQCPQLGAFPLGETTAGWDNVLLRLGQNLAVRLPRTAWAAESLRREQRFLPQLGDRLAELRIPTPLYCGDPEPGLFPFAWSVVPWFAGEPLEGHLVGHESARALGLFLAQLHQRAPRHAPFNPYRSVPLAQRLPALGQAIERARDLDYVGPLSAEFGSQSVELVDYAAALPQGATSWIHGDLHARNLIALEGKLIAVIDFGDIAQGQRSVDLACAWLLNVPPAVRAELRRHAGSRRLITEAEWEQARAWAVCLAWGMTPDPSLANLARATLLRVFSS